MIPELRRLINFCGIFLCICLVIPFNVYSQAPEHFTARRQRIADSLSPKTVMVLRAAPRYLRNVDVHHDFRQSNSLYYLTGYPEQDAVLLLSGSSNIYPKTYSDPVQAMLFVLPRDKKRETWDGIRYGADRAASEFGIEAAADLTYLEDVAMRLFAHVDTVMIDYSLRENERPLLEDVALIEEARGRLFDMVVVDAATHLENYRQIKDDVELQLLQKAIDITCDAQRHVLRVARPGMFEYQIQAEIEYVFKNSGAPRVGFPSIVGSGPMTCIMHYGENSRQTRAGDLVLMDIGAEYGMYAADVTRTIPVSGKFSNRQRAVYELVLAAQQAAIDVIRPGIALREVQDAAETVVKHGLVTLGLIDSPHEFKKYWLHGTSHMLGMDVHDVGSLKILEPGMVFTVEPGIYIPEEEIGVRIEDDVVVTETGCRVLSDAPKTVKEIERAMRR